MFHTARDSALRVGKTRTGARTPDSFNNLEGAGSDDMPRIGSIIVNILHGRGLETITG